MDLWIDEAKLFDKLVGSFQKLFVFGLQFKLSDRKALEDALYLYFGACVAGSLAIGMGEVKFAMA